MVAASSLRRAALAAVCLLLAACGGGSSGNPHCNSASECQSGQNCLDNECVTAGQCPSTRLSCTSSLQCPSGQSCTDSCCGAVSGCISDTDCSGTTPHCDTATHACKACSGNGQCSGGKLCVADGSCATGCAVNTDCKDATKPFCHNNGTVSVCSECNVNSDCHDASKPACISGSCGGCSGNNDCPSATPACDTGTHVCVACLDAGNNNGVNASCTGAAKACHNKTCVTCDPNSNGVDTKNGACTNAALPVCVGSTSFSCVACDPAANAGSPPTNAACGGALFCANDNTCVECSDTVACTGGKACGSDHHCHTPALASACVPSGSACPATTTAFFGTSVSVVAKLDINAVTATTVSFALSGGAASFASGSAVSTTTATVPVGSATSAAVTVYLDPSNTSADVIVTASLAGSSNQVATIHVTNVAAALSDFGPAGTNVQEGKSATLTATLTGSPSTDATVTFTNDDAGIATLSASSVVIHSGGETTGTVTLNAVANASGTVHLHASYSGVTKDLNVTVFKVAVTALAASPTTVSVNGTSTVTVTVGTAPPAAATVAITGTGGAGSFPATATIAASATTGTFTFTAGASAGSETLTATGADASSQQATITVSATTASGCTGNAQPLVLSAIFGDGGFTGTPTSPWKSDYIEIHNRDIIAHSLNGLSVQYAAYNKASGAASGKINLNNVSLAAGGYYLIAACTGAPDCGSTATGGTNSIPTPDQSATGTGAINLSFSHGKVFLVNSVNAITLDATGAPDTASAPLVLDGVGYGTDATWGEGGTHAPVGSEKPDYRKNSGCDDSNSNGVDWDNTTPPNPRNTSTEAATCSVCGGTL